jgi:hypothetical protein
MEHDITLSAPLPRPHLEEHAHLSSLHACFDEVILLLDELVGLLMTWHMGSWHILTYSYLDPLLLMFIGPHMPFWGLLCTHVEAYCWIKGGCPFFSWRWLSVIDIPHVEALYHGSTCLI